MNITTNKDEIIQNKNKIGQKINLITKITDLAMKITLEYIEAGDCVIDATAGNGHDTLILAEAVGNNGRVIAFDIQKNALENTEKLLKENGLIERVKLVNDSHENIMNYVQEENRPSAIIFNFGYLPTGDKSITTKGNSSVSAINAASKLIKLGGIITLVLYSGHEEGRIEKKMILDMLGGLSSTEYHVAYTSMINQSNNPPEIIWITKKK
ncbi:MAG: class I SAM-dependent methyltransferase [Aminipila sp.]